MPNKKGVKNLKFRMTDIPEHLLGYFEGSGDVVSVHNTHPT